MVESENDVDLYKLELFYWVAELKSFSRAAEHLSLRQPTVSAHVRALEEKLGSKVLNRVGGEVTPTPMGQVLLGQARALLALKKDTLAALDHFQGRITGELVIGGSNIPGEYILPGKLGAFIKKYPEVKPILRIGDSAGIVEAVLDGEVELGFVGFKGEDRRLSFQKIWRDEMVLTVPKGHPWARHKSVDVSVLAKEGFISREGGSGTLRSIRNILSRKGQEPEKLLNVIMELGSTEAVKEALIAGFGISILSRTSIQREIRDGFLKEVPIRGLKLERDFFQVFHRRRTLSPVSQAFVHFLKQG
ncbi:MAG: LysR family transcriptional regulator [Deltaproteobacteria bacterium]|nr:LysR family transcriptional regulator [Deltaproteobacteria bacterium]